MYGNLARIVPVILVCSVMGSAQQSIPAGVKAPQVTPPAPQAHQPPSGRQTSDPVSGAAPSPVRIASNPGTIVGYVYWDTKAVQHNPPLTCNGLAVTLSVGTSPSGSTPAFEQFKPLGTYNSFTYLNNGSAFGVCAYALKQVPLGQDLQVKITATPSSFSSLVAPITAPTANNSNGPIKIIGGNCNNLPPAVPSPSVLGSHWWTCGDYAYNVNFVLQASGAVHLMSAGSPSLLGQQSVPGTQQPAPRVVPSGTPGQVQSARADQKPSLTNGDVVKMVKAGVPEATIASSIQSSPRKFDLSPDALLVLHRAGVSQKILDVMMADGSAKRGVASRTIKLGPAKTGEIVKNPRAAQADAAIIAVLENQKQAAELEASRMVRTGVRPAGIQVGPSQAMSATTANGAMTPMPAGIQRSSTPGTIPPGKGSGSPGNSVASLGIAPHLQATALTCATDPAIRILNVSGEFHPSTFTPDAKYNFYTITGCSFGDSGPNSKVYIYYQDIFHQDFQIQEWNDNGIKLNLNPSLKGVLDQDNLTLVIQRNDGKQATKSGFKFYAARDMTLLRRIPQGAFSLNHFTLTNTTDLQATYTSPSSPNVIPDVSGYSAEVSWECTDCSANRDHPNFSHWAPSGEDIYQFKNLQPGFVATQAAMVSVDASCQGTLHREGNFGLNWVGDDLHATWQGQTCQWSGCGGFAQPDCFGQGPGSNYAVNVWVTGPRGVDPWTGKPN
jgi:hypothetical protein